MIWQLITQLIYLARYSFQAFIMNHYSYHSLINRRSRSRSRHISSIYQRYCFKHMLRLSHLELSAAGTYTKVLYQCRDGFIAIGKMMILELTLCRM